MNLLTFIVGIQYPDWVDGWEVFQGKTKQVFMIFLKKKPTPFFILLMEEYDGRASFQPKGKNEAIESRAFNLVYLWGP